MSIFSEIMIILMRILFLTDFEIYFLGSKLDENDIESYIFEYEIY